jgi:shikimate kinase
MAPIRKSRPAAAAVLGGYPITLTGMMGVGKTTVGRNLAFILDRRFIDSDNEIERSAGMPIADIFAQYGEPEFRDLELRVVRRLADQEQVVISTGGGAFIAPQTRRVMLSKTHVVCLTSTIDDIVGRLSRTNNRPMLRDDLRASLRDLMRSREALYRLAHMTFESSNAQTPKILARTIAAALAQVCVQPSPP